MAKTYNRICIKTETFTDGERSLTLKRGKEYLTTPEYDGQVRVLSTYWFWAPASLFTAEEVFTR